MKNTKREWKLYKPTIIMVCIGSLICVATVILSELSEIDLGSLPLIIGGLIIARGIMVAVKSKRGRSKNYPYPRKMRVRDIKLENLFICLPGIFVTVLGFIIAAYGSNEMEGPGMGIENMDGLFIGSMGLIIIIVGIIMAFAAVTSTNRNRHRTMRARKPVPITCHEPNRYYTAPIVNVYPKVIHEGTRSIPHAELPEPYGLDRSYTAVVKALKENPFNQVLHYEKARILERMGLLSEAIQSARSAYFLDPINQQVAAYMRDLEMGLSGKEDQR